MQDKQKVTLYIPTELHRQLKIRSAVDAESMSEIAERALAFYLEHGEAVAEIEAATQGNTHRVYACPSCATPVVIQSEQLVQLDQGSAILNDHDLSVTPDLNPALSSGR